VPKYLPSKCEALSLNLSTAPPQNKTLLLKFDPQYSQKTNKQTKPSIADNNNNNNNNLYILVSGQNVFAV
jgi:hypothetical protein